MNAVATPVAGDAELAALQHLVETNPGQICDQIAELTGVDREVILDRLQALQRAGLVHAAEMTISRFTGRLASAWRPGRDPLISRREVPPDVVEAYSNALAAVVPPVDPTFAADVAA
jgi:predicted ArsR family transcriptional regulator